MRRYAIAIPAIGLHTGTKRAILLLWSIVSLGAVLRLATLSGQSLWLDEASSYWIANRSWSHLIAQLPSHDPHPPLHYLVLHPMIVLGGTEWLLRFPSALAGIVSIGLLYALGVELFDRQTGLLATFVLAVSPLHIWYAQEVRMYALVAAFTLAAGLFVARALRTNHPVDWLGLAICQGLALWTSTAAIWFTLALNILALLTIVVLWRSQRFWPFAGAQALAIAIYAPWIPIFVQQSKGNFAGWIPPATLTVVARTLGDFAGSYERPGAEALLALLVLTAGLAAGGFGLIHEARTSRVRYALLGCWLAVPIGLAFLISQPYVRVPLVSLVMRPGGSVFLTRNLIVATFPLYLLLARSLLLSRRVVGSCILAALIGLSMTAYVGNALTERKADYRAAARIVAAQARPDDLILFAPDYLKLPFAYYYHRPAGELSLDSLRDGIMTGSDRRTYTSPVAALDDYHRVWLVTSSNIYQTDTQGTVAAVQARGQLLDSRQVEGVTVRLYEK